MKGFLYHSENELFGQSKIVIGYGSDDFYIKKIDRLIAKEFVIQNHYSKKIFNNSYIHLGCFIKGIMLGVLQFGHMLNNKANIKIVKDTRPGEGIELNRMVFLESKEKNSESRAIAYSIKYIKNQYPNVKWIQSFADERCGKFGIVYQASNFGYYGEHRGDFYEHEGKFYHEIALTKDRKKAGAVGAELRKIKHKLKKIYFRQFRYLYFIDQREKQKCLLDRLPFPKHYEQNWQIVIMISDCKEVDGEYYCPVCELEYSECKHPGPMQDGYEYKIEDEKLLAKKIKLIKS